MNIKDIQTDPLLAALYEHDKWSQLARTGSPYKGEYTLPLDTASSIRNCTLCEHFEHRNPWDKCRHCTEFMQWIACPEKDSLFTMWLESETPKDRSYFAYCIAQKCLEAAIRFIEEYEEY